MGTQWVPPRTVVAEDWLGAEFLAEAAPWVAEGEQTYFDRLAGGADRDILLFGAGNLGRRTLAGLRGVGVEPLAFLDNNPSLQGTIVDGVPVRSAREVPEYARGRTAVVTTVWSPNRPLAHQTLATQLDALHGALAVPFVPLYWKWAAKFLPYHCLDLPHRLYEQAPHVKAAYALFADLVSQVEFRTQLSYVLSAMDYVGLESPRSGAFFPEDLFELSQEEVFVDCGAFDGDTIRTFLAACHGRFREVVAFEPDLDAVGRLRNMVAELLVDGSSRVRVEEAAVGNTPGFVSFEGGGTHGSRISEKGPLRVACVTLDEALAGVAPTFIKMDIEGAERAALLGADRTIRDHRPILAVCVYHLQDDLHTLPLLLSRLCVDYSLFLRRRAVDNELLCFAVPDERLRRR
ncbi:MAG: FkbM family methyltransferase [Isosphaeraceae bacterium]|nr:FkbM family methyltransferase [Isosphaeraceae bacterium]